MKRKEKIFISYREAFFHILTYISSSFDIYNRLESLPLNESQRKTIDLSLFNEIILNLAKLYENGKDSRCLFRFLKFCQSCPFVFESDEVILSERKAERITTVLISQDMERLNGMVKQIQNIREWRDKLLVHIDGKYMGDNNRLMRDYPINQDDLKEAIEFACTLVEKYSLSFDGKRLIK